MRPTTRIARLARASSAQRDVDCAASSSSLATPSATPAGFIDLFAGIGCVAHGFARTGYFDPIALVDVDGDAARTCRAALGEVDYLERDLARLSVREFYESADGRPIAGIVGCPPCQGFSAAGRRQADDPRNRLLGAYFSFIAELKPAFFVMENVPSVLYRAELAELLATAAADYVTVGGVVNAACYGVPQTRQRTLLIGYRREFEITPTLPPPTHWGSRPIFLYGAQKLARPTLARLADVLGDSPHIGIAREQRRDMRQLLPSKPAELANFVLLNDALADLPQPVARGEQATGTAGYGSRVSAYAQSLREAIPTKPERCLANHEIWGHREASRLRMADVTEGGRASSRGRYHSQAYARLHRRGLARTITTNFHNAGCGRFTHPTSARTLTVREAARLQGIPDGMEFAGLPSTQERLVGNAFPPPLAEAIARHIAGQLGDNLAS